MQLYQGREGGGGGCPPLHVYRRRGGTPPPRASVGGSCNFFCHFSQVSKVKKATLLSQYKYVWCFIRKVAQRQPICPVLAPLYSIPRHSKAKSSLLSAMGGNEIWGQSLHWKIIINLPTRIKFRKCYNFTQGLGLVSPFLYAKLRALCKGLTGYPETRVAYTMRVGGPLHGGRGPKTS